MHIYSHLKEKVIACCILISYVRCDFPLSLRSQITMQSISNTTLLQLTCSLLHPEHHPAYPERRPSKYRHITVTLLSRRGENAAQTPACGHKMVNGYQTSPLPHLSAISVINPLLQRSCIHHGQNTNSVCLLSYIIMACDACTATCASAEQQTWWMLHWKQCH